MSSTSPTAQATTTLTSTDASTTAPALAVLPNLPRVFEVRPMTAESDWHGAACGWGCEDAHGDPLPMVTNVYFRDADGDTFTNTCGRAVCILAATELRDPDYDVVVEFSTAPVDPDVRAAGLAAVSGW